MTQTPTQQRFTIPVDNQSDWSGDLTDIVNELSMGTFVRITAANTHLLPGQFLQTPVNSRNVYTQRDGRFYNNATHTLLCVDTIAPNEEGFALHNGIINPFTPMNYSAEPNGQPILFSIYTPGIASSSADTFTCARYCATRISTSGIAFNAFPLQVTAMPTATSCGFGNITTPFSSVVNIRGNVNLITMLQVVAHSVDNYRIRIWPNSTRVTSIVYDTVVQSGNISVNTAVYTDLSGIAFSTLATAPSAGGYSAHIQIDVLSSAATTISSGVFDVKITYRII